MRHFGASRFPKKLGHQWYSPRISRDEKRRRVLLVSFRRALLMPCLSSTQGQLQTSIILMSRHAHCDAGVACRRCLTSEHCACFFRCCWQHPVFCMLPRGVSDKSIARLHSCQVLWRTTGMERSKSACSKSSVQELICHCGYIAMWHLGCRYQPPEDRPPLGMCLCLARLPSSPGDPAARGFCLSRGTSGME